MDYSLVNSEGKETLVVLVDDELVTLSPSHVNYRRIRKALRKGTADDEKIRAWIDAGRFIGDQLRQLSERVTYRAGQIYFDGDLINTALSRHILRVLRQGEDYRSPVAFMENLALNPSAQSRWHLWKWLEKQGTFTLTEDGYVVGYKAVKGEENLSITAGSEDVYVDGVVHQGHIPNPVGAVVEMSRALVNPDRDHACSVGLHVGTFDFAKAFGSGTAGQRILTVLVNPRDVVAVPADSDNAKMRVCRYKVADVTEVEHTEPVLFAEGEDEDEEWHDFWDAVDNDDEDEQ